MFVQDLRSPSRRVPTSRPVLHDALKFGVSVVGWAASRISLVTPAKPFDHCSTLYGCSDIPASRPIRTGNTSLLPDKRPQA
jgi:hypothetical protein